MPFGSIDAEEASSSSHLHLKPLIFRIDGDHKSKNIEASIYLIRIIGSCNGLLLISLYANLYLWNPTTRQSTKVLSIQTDVPSNFRFIAKSGLCNDSYSDDYKAVLVNSGLFTVISFKRKYWATKTCSFVNEDDAILGCGPVVNEKLHWVKTCFRNHSIDFPPHNTIVYFDPLTDEFIELQMPLVPNNEKCKSKILGLGVLDGCLSMTRFLWERGDEAKPNYAGDEVEPGYNFIDEVEPDFIEVLVMKEHGEGESWTSVFIVSKSLGCLESGPNSVYTILPLCVTKNGEVLFSVNGNKLLAYNPHEMSQRYIHIGCNELVYYEASHEESVASPTAYGHEEDWIVEGPDALNFLRYIGWWDYLSNYCYCDREFLNTTKENSFVKEDSSSEEEDDCVLKSCWKKEDDQKKYNRREKARLYSILAKDKRQKTQQRIRAQSKIRCIRKNEQKKKQGKNLELEDLHKQESDVNKKGSDKISSLFGFTLTRT